MLRKSLGLAVLPILMACPASDVDPLPGTPDGGSAPDAEAPRDLGPPDTGMPDLGMPDTGPIDTGITPLRRLTTYTFQGTTPTNNLVMAPFFDTTASVGPAATSNNGTLTRYVRWDTPSQTPALRLQNAGVLLFVQGRPAPLSASLWVGQPLSTEFRRTQVVIVGLGETDFEAGEMLEQDAASEVVLGTLRWRQYRGTISQNLLGNAFMFVSPEATDVYIAGPVVTQLQARGRFEPQTKSIELTGKMRNEIRQTWEAWAARSQRQLQPPHVRPRLRVPQLPQK